MDSDHGPVDRYATEQAAPWGTPLIFIPFATGTQRRGAPRADSKRGYNHFSSHTGVDTCRSLFAN